MTFVEFVLRLRDLTPDVEIGDEHKTLSTHHVERLEREFRMIVDEAWIDAHDERAREERRRSHADSK